MTLLRASHIPPSIRKSLNAKILRWYRETGRKLPWRRTSDPYRILVSEVMLQQTQVSRVEEKYPEFIKRYPNIRALAHARTSDVIRSWRGMGYNRRAVHLKRTAVEVVLNFGGKIPSDATVLRKLPGIGRYTANALLATAFKKRVAVVDTNIGRVLARLFRHNSGLSIEWELADGLLPRSSASEWNQALMDLGALVCTARSPRCDSCPVSRECLSAFQPRIELKKAPENEPSRRDIPDRLHRGKVIEILRSLNGRGRISERLLLKSILPTVRSGDLRWMRRLIGGLERDGLVSVYSNKNTHFVGLVK